jgi:hypothetical protein
MHNESKPQKGDIWYGRGGSSFEVRDVFERDGEARVRFKVLQRGGYPCHRTGVLDELPLTSFRQWVPHKEAHERV